MRNLSRPVQRVLLLAALLALPLVARPSGTQAQTADCMDPPSWLAGAVELCDGTLIYRDYLYDDYGADDPAFPNTANTTTGSLARPAGDARYDAANVNSADLVDLKLWVDGSTLHVEAEMAALFNADSTIVAVAIDTDNNSATGGGEWGDLVALDSTKLTSTGWDVLATFDDGDPATNLVTGSMPLPAGATWRVQAVTAKKDNTVMNVAFRGLDEETVTGAWWEDKQAAALADGDISAFGHTVSVADLTGGATQPAAHDAPGFHQRVYTSKYTLAPGEGVNYAGVPGRHGTTSQVCEQEFHFLGKYQPYGIFVPDKPGPHGMQLALHGCNANHSSLVDQPGMQQQLGTDLNRVVVVPLGRGPIGYYSDISEADVLDVMADVESTYPIDLERVFAGGYSMGGYGTFRFSMLYPDRFAGFVSWVGFTGECSNNPVGPNTGFCESGAIGNVIDFTRNTRHVPGIMIYAGADELVHATSAAAMQQSFDTAGVPYAWYMHPAAEHLTFAVVDEWPKEAAYTKDLVRVKKPARVVFRTDQSLDYPDYAIKHDAAYWVSAIKAKGAGYSDVDLTSLACGGSVPTYTTGNNAGIEPLPWVSEFRNITGTSPLARADRLEGTLVNVASLRIDAAATCLAGRALTYKLTTDGPLTMVLSDGRTISLAAAGEHSGTLAAAAGSVNVPSASGATRGASGSLPATGGAMPLGLGALALVAALALRRSASRGH